MADQAPQDGPRQDALSGMLQKLVAKETAETHPELVAELSRIMLATNPRSIAAAQRGMAVRPNMVARLAEINVPSLVLCGEHDVITTPEEMHQMADAIPNSTFHQIARAGHMAPLENPVEVNDAIGSFFASLR